MQYHFDFQNTIAVMAERR